jgi:phage terminase large subunit-like protein
MEITNAHLPGEGSFAEATHDAFVAAGGKLDGVYYDSVEAPLLTRKGPNGQPEVVPLAEMSDEQVVDGLRAGRGDSGWLDTERLLDEMRDPTADESRSRRFYFNQVTKVGAAWLPPGAWDATEDKSRTIPDHAEVVLGFDGSLGDDVTCLVVVSVDEAPHLDVVKAWVKPADDPLWKPSRREVKDTVREACKRWKVREIAWDMYVWRDAAEELEEEGLPVVEFPQRGAMMIPATQRFYQAVTGKTMTHSGDPLLAAHVANARVKTDSRGSRLTKDGDHSPRKIDLAVASVMAFERAGALAHIHEQAGVVVAGGHEFSERMTPERIAEVKARHQARIDAIMAKGRGR